MKIDEIRGFNDKELMLKIKELEEELFKLKLKLTTGELEDTSKVRKVRKDIAVIKTVYSQRLRGINQ
jgi:large subunit ribosomal protein L29